jgi:hypothetical protein
VRYTQDAIRPATVRAKFTPLKSVSQGDELADTVLFGYQVWRVNRRLIFTQMLSTFPVDNCVDESALQAAIPRKNAPDFNLVKK